MFVFETRYAPLYLHAFPASFEPEELEAHFEEVEGHFSRRAVQQPTGLLADVSSLMSIDEMTRRRVAKAFRNMAPVMGECAVAHAIVAGSPVARSALTTIFSLKGPGWPVRMFEDLEAADVWLREAFVERGLPRPSAPPTWWQDALRAKKMPAPRVD